MVDSFLGWLGPSTSTAFTLYSKEEDESSTGSNRDGGGEGDAEGLYLTDSQITLVSDASWM